MRLFYLLLLTASTLSAQTSDPILIMNTGMHTSIVKRVSTDARGRYLLTTSQDKTAKLWDMASGSLIRTFRSPIGEANEGKIFAGALSPDGRTAVISGWTSTDGLSNFIYFFDASTGAITRSIRGVPNIILDLEYSPDGRYIVAALGGSNGIRVYRASDGSLFAQDTDYDGASYNIAFDTWGNQLASVCEDGYLRLYDGNFKLQKKSKVVGGYEPFSLAYSPDGSLLAVGFEDSPAIQVLDAKTLALRYSPNVDGANTNDNRIEMIAFSSDGTQLAGGYSYKKFKDPLWWREVRIWSLAGRGSFVDVDGGRNGIMDIKPLPMGGFVFCGSFPDWGSVNAAGQQVHYKEAEVQDYASTDKTLLRLGVGGTEVGVTPYGKRALTFDVSTRRLIEGNSTAPAANADRNGLQVTDYNGKTDPKLNGKSFGFLEKYEPCQSAAVASGGAGIALGASWNVYCTDATGHKRWKQQVSGTAWCVNVDPTNQVVVAGLSDGTIRWYRFRDGEPLLTLYIHPDRKRWVLWTPGGYFDCTPGAEDLLGWHVNQGAEREAEFYLLSKFRERFNRPDVIDRILETLDETTALQEADAAKGKSSGLRNVSVLDELPPTVRIFNPADNAQIGSTKLTLAYQLQSPNNEPITKLIILIDGRPIATGRGFKPLGQRLEEPIEVPAANCTLSIVAENRFGVSEAATVRLQWKSTTTISSMTGVDIRPKLYVLAIGVSKYLSKDIGQLDYADDDARSFAALFQKQKGSNSSLYADVQTRVLLDGAATRDAVIDGLDWLEKETTSRDVAMLFFAGHGVDDRNGNFFYLPATADPNNLKRTGVSKSEVQTTVASVAGKIVVFMDACHSGSVMQPIGVRKRGDMLPEIAPVVNELIAVENGAIVFCSTTNRQAALEDAAWGHGAFTLALLEGLGGKAFSPGTKKITIKTLDAYVAERVKELTNRQQTPTTVCPPDVPDFPISYGN